MGGTGTGWTWTGGAWGSVELGPRVRVTRITEDRIVGVRWDELGREAVVVWEVGAAS